MGRLPFRSVATPSPAANIPELINRREFLKRVAGSAGTAALSGPVVSRVVGGAAEAASPYMDDLSGFTGIRLTPMDGEYGGPGVLETMAPESWWDRAHSGEAGREYDRIRRELFESFRARPSSPLQVVGDGPGGLQDVMTLPYEWNRATGQWHAAVYDPVSSSTKFLQHGATPPSGASFPWGWESPATGMDYGISYYGKTPGETYAALHDDYSRALARSMYDSGIDKKAMRENPHYAKEARRHMDEKGLAPGGRYEQPPVLADSGDLTGNFGLVGGEALPPDDPQPKRMWSRSPSGLNRAASGAALSAFLLAPLLSLQQQQENR